MSHSTIWESQRMLSMICKAQNIRRFTTKWYHAHGLLDMPTKSILKLKSG